MTISLRFITPSLFIVTSRDEFLSRDVPSIHCACLYKRRHRTSKVEDGFDVAIAVASAAGIRTDTACRQQGWFITRRQDHPHRVPAAVHGSSRSH